MQCADLGKGRNPEYKKKTFEAQGRSTTGTQLTEIPYQTWLRFFGDESHNTLTACATH